MLAPRLNTKDSRRLAMLFGNNNGTSTKQQLLDGAPFLAQLTKNLLLQRGTGTATLTRATTKTFTDHEGVLRTAPAGCAAFTGARFVRNLLTYTEDFSNAAWTATAPGGGSIVLATGVSDPFGTSRATTWTRSGGTDVVGKFQSITTVTGNKYLNSIYLKRRTGTGAVYLRTINNTNVDVSGDLSSTEWLRIDSGTTAASGTTGYFVLTIGTDGDAIDVFGTQIEDITGRTDQTTPSEYVSVGVLSAPYHGAGIDGARFYDVGLDGSPLTTLDGISIEGAGTNLWTYSQAFDNAAWTKSTITVAANDAVAPDGTTTTDKLTNNDTVSVLDRTVTVTANTTYTDSIHLKYGNNAWARILYGTGANAVQLWVNIQTGTIGTVTASGGTAVMSAYSIESVSGGYWRIQAAVNLGGATTAFQRRSYLVNADNSGTIVAAAYAYYWGAQVELGSFATSYIPTTTTAATRNLDLESTPTASNVAAAASSVYLEYTPLHAPSGTVFLWATYVDASNYTAILHDATNLICRKRIAGVNYDATIANAFVSGTTYKAVGTWGAGGVTITLNGTEGTPHANTTSAQIGSTMQTGGDGNGANQAGMSFKNVRIAQRQYSASERLAVTA